MGEPMNDDESREWTFQLNIAGLTLLLFASAYIGQHLAVLYPLSGASRIATHYLGELVLTAVAFGYALSRAFGASQPQRRRVDWLKRSPVWLYVGLAAVLVNLILLTVLLVLGKL
jgi:uncharacterized membrane protein YidH (DUF202 family)